MANTMVKREAAEDETLRRLTKWVEQRGDLRAMILTSTRAIPDVPLDAFSDYDIILVTFDLHPYFADRAWLGDFGQVLVVYRDPIRLELGYQRFAYITQYEDGTKIDFTLWQVELLQHIVEQGELPVSLDIGFQVLVDKDKLAARLPAPTCQAHIPAPPTEKEYLDAIEEFFHEATYAAKHLWRDDLLPAKYNLDNMMKHKWLRQMLEWRIEIDHAWSWRPGAYGKGLKKLLRPAVWAALEDTYTGAGIEQNWQALFKTVALFRSTASEVGEYLGFAYPAELDRRVTAYLRRVKKRAIKG